MGRTGDCSSATAQCDRPSRESRIPTALQHVFIASQKGEEVHHPPPGRLASTTFFRSFGLRFPPQILRQSLQRFELRGKSAGKGSPHIKHDKKKSRSKAEVGVQPHCVRLPSENLSHSYLSVAHTHALSSSLFRCHDSLAWVFYQTFQHFTDCLLQPAD